MKFISWFQELSIDDIPSAGGKGASLGEMYNADIPVPNGFAITAQTYGYVIEKTGIADQIYDLLEDLDVEDTSKLQDVARKIQELIIRSEMPVEVRSKILEAYDQMNGNFESLGNISREALEIFRSGKELPYVAVRSSATAEDLPDASFAGQQETFLNIKGNANLLKSVQKCWASLFTARAIYYRVKNNYPHDKVLISVIVQKQIMAQKSGVMFTVNPLNANENEVMIEAGYGLGEAIVSGSINPDQYIAEKQPFKIKSKTINKQEWMFTLDPNLGTTARRGVLEKNRSEQKLSDYEIKQLVDLAKKIEEHYLKPQDIEFAIEGMKVYIVQSRPITTLKKVSTEKVDSSKFTTEPLLKGTPASPGTASGKVRIVRSPEDIRYVEQGEILVAQMTSPDYVPAMRRASAIVTDSGGTTSHAAIVSRELGIPCVVGTMTATALLQNGREITVDGYSGKVYEGLMRVETPKPQAPVYASSNNAMPMSSTPQPMSSEVPRTITEIKLIMDIPDLAEHHRDLAIDGIGLMRLEVVIANAGVHPAKYIRENREYEYVDLLVRELEKAAVVFPTKPIWVRTSDFRTDEYRNLDGGDIEPHEANPMLGWHGIRRALDDRGILRAELTAIRKLHEKGYKNFGIMIPFVISVDEVKAAKDLVLEVGLNPLHDVEFGVMIETPASVQIIEDICKEGVSFVSIGSNDLTQLTLGIDRNNEHIAKLFSELHPGVLKEIKHVVEVCKRYNVRSSICGQAGSTPEMAEFLVKVGIDSISVNPDAVTSIRSVVAQGEKRLLLSMARRELGL